MPEGSSRSNAFGPPKQKLTTQNLARRPSLTSKWRPLLSAQPENRPYRASLRLLTIRLRSKKILDEKESISVEAERPFLSSSVLLCFQAYSIVLMSAVMQIKVLATSPATADLLDTEHASKLLKAALPEHTEYIEKYGLAAHYPCLMSWRQSY